MIIIVC